MIDHQCYEDLNTGIIYDHLCSFLSCSSALRPSQDCLFCPSFCYCFACRNFDCPKNPATSSDAASYMKKHPELTADESSLDEIWDDDLPF